MKISNDDLIEYTEGQAVIVGFDMSNGDNVKNDYVKKQQTDSVVVYDATCLSAGEPQMLAYVNFAKIPDDTVIYLCGHGNRKNMTIDNRSMKEIASMFQDAFYTGKQKIIIMSCKAVSRRKRKDMAFQLKKELEKRQIVAEVEAVAKGTTIVTQESASTYVKDLQYSKGEETAFRVYQNLLSQKVETTVASGLPKNCHSHKRSIENWNNLVCSKAGDKLISVAANCIDRITSLIVSILILALTGIDWIPPVINIRSLALLAILSYILSGINRIFKIDRITRPIPIYFINTMVVSYSLILLDALLIFNSNAFIVLAAVITIGYVVLPIRYLHRATFMVARLSVG